MSELVTKITIPQEFQITTPYVLAIMRIIKQIQQRMKDPDIVDLDYPRMYNKLSLEFDEFFNKFTSIFVKVTRGESLNIIAANLYYLDKVAKGEMEESAVADMVATKYLPKHLKEESDLKLKEMKETKNPEAL